MQVEVYSKIGCKYCEMAKQLLKKRGIDHEVIDVSAGSIEDQVLAREQLIDRVVLETGTPPTTMPQIFVDGDHVGGYDELVKILDEA